jgi:hypothetical protein
MLSQEYIGAAVLLVGAVLKMFKVEIDNGSIEAVIAGAVSAWIMYRRYKKGDITVGGFRK